MTERLHFHFSLACIGEGMEPTPVFLPGESQGQRSLVGCSPWGRTELDTTEWLHFHSSRSCIGEGNGNPLQCSCLENPRDRGAWWAAVHGVAQSQTQLKWLSSSSSSLSVVSLTSEIVSLQIVKDSKQSSVVYFYHLISIISILLFCNCNFRILGPSFNKSLIDPVCICD